MVDAVIKIFESNATSFTTNGIGYLPDVIECTVVEERNGEFELSMTYPITGKRYSEIMNRRILVAKSNPFSEPQPFRIYEITKPLKGKVSVYAEHISYDLSGIPVKPFVASTIQEALIGLKNNALVYCPFTFSSDKSTVANYGVYVPNSIRSELAGVEGSILDVYRGEYEFDRYSVKLWNNRGMDRGVTIRYGKNLTDLEQTDNVAKLYSGVLPYWYSDLEENGGLVQGTIVPVPGITSFTKVLVLDCSYDFQEKPTVEQLTAFATSYITTNGLGTIKSSTTVSFIDLSESKEYENLMNFSKVHLCDTVTVEYTDLGVKVTAKCVKTKYNVLEDRYDSIELGEAKASLADTLTSNNDKLTEEFEKKIISTSAADTNEFKKNLNQAYNELLGDIQNVSDTSAAANKKLTEDLKNFSDDAKASDEKLANDLKTASEESAAADKKLADDLKKTNESMTAADKKLAEDMAEFNDNLQQLIATTVENEATEREMAIAYATGMITGNLGGYVILHSSTNADYPDEILIMDTMNVETAKKIWRWNKSGLGYSNMGYEGPYTLAMTQDGVFVADFIQSGSINASLITTGFMSASIIKGGTLILGGADNGNGTFLLRDNSNNSIAYMSNAGLSLYKGTISGPNITVGGSNNQNGGLTVLDSNGAVAGTWNNNSLTINQNGQLRIITQALNLNGDSVERVTSFNNGIKMTYGGQTYFWISPLQWVRNEKQYLGGFFIGAKSHVLDIGNIDKPDTPTIRINLDGYDTTDLPYDDPLQVAGNVRFTSGSLFLGGPMNGLPASTPSERRKSSGGIFSLSGFSASGGGYYSTGDIYVKCKEFDIWQITNMNNSAVPLYSPCLASAFTVSSSRKTKTNIEAMTEEEAKKLLDVEVVTFDYKEPGNGIHCRGVIAEDVFDIMEWPVYLDDEGYPKSVDYSRFVPYLIKMVQMQQKEIEELKKSR